jgi:hypothetical protein
MKVAFVGSRSYTNVPRIRAVMGKYIERYGKENLTIVSGGCPDGADFFARKVALEMGLIYKEFPPAHQKHNVYCILGPECYNRPYQVRYFFERNTKIAEYCEQLIAFVLTDVKASGTMDTYVKTRNMGKPVHLMKD